MVELHIQAYAIDAARRARRREIEKYPKLREMHLLDLALVGHLRREELLDDVPLAPRRERQR